MLADPLANVTLSGAAQTLPRIFLDGRKAIYQKNDQTLTITVSQETVKEAGVNRQKSRVHVEQKFTAPDPYNAEAGNKDFFLRCTIIIDKPNLVVTQTNAVDLFTMASAFLTAGTNANLIKLYGGEF